MRNPLLPAANAGRPGRSGVARGRCSPGSSGIPLPRRLAVTSALTVPSARSTRSRRVSRFSGVCLPRRAQRTTGLNPSFTRLPRCRCCRQPPTPCAAAARAVSVDQRPPHRTPSFTVNKRWDNARRSPPPTSHTATALTARSGPGFFLATGGRSPPPVAPPPQADRPQQRHVVDK